MTDREICRICLQPAFACYCSHVRRFDPKIKFVILTHSLEVRRRIATGRMSYLCLEGSLLIRGYGYAEDPAVNALLADSSFFPVVLYPGVWSMNLSALSEGERAHLFPADKTLLVFVIDGTWHTARRTLNRSPNLNALPRIAFTPPRASTFRVRKQPRPGCLSTIEAIHQTIELLGPGRGFDLSSRLHDNLLAVFDRLVEQQIALLKEVRARTPHLNYRRKKEPNTLRS